MLNSFQHSSRVWALSSMAGAPQPAPHPAGQGRNTAYLLATATGAGYGVAMLSTGELRLFLRAWAVGFLLFTLLLG